MHEESPNGRTNVQSLPTVFALLADRQRRTVLTVLSDRETLVKEQTLATLVAAEEGDKSPEEVAEEERDELHAALHHKHLPALEAAEMIERDADGLIRFAEYPAVEDRWAQKLLQEASASERQNRLDVVCHPRRRAILAVLNEQREPLSVPELAKRVAATEAEKSVVDVTADEQQRVHVSLYHVHLPKVAATNLVAYDREAETAAIEETLAPVEQGENAGLDVRALVG